MGARWDEHDERAFVRQAGVRPRLSLGYYRLKLCGASAQTVSLCPAARRGCLSPHSTSGVGERCFN